MPHVKINFDDIVFDREVYSYCLNDKFKCPNYNHSYSCPPAATFLKDRVSQFKEFYLVYSKHDLDAYIKEVKKKHPKRSEQRIRNSFFLKGSYNEIYEEISRFLDNYKETYKPPHSQWITRVGLILRKTSLDELPQIINVIKGEMSIVGPRPNVPWEVEEYYSWQHERLEVLPGITGLAQVKGRSCIEFCSLVRYDVEYIECCNILLDIKILWWTLKGIFVGEGAM